MPGAQDWVISYFNNYYNVSQHVNVNTNPYYRDAPQARMEAYQDSEIYRHGTGNCKQEGNCKEGANICHRVSPEWMMEEMERWKRNVPHKFQ